MDSFEQLAADIFWNEGHWVRNSVKVTLSREEKQRIGRPSSPRWELDLVAYHSESNTLKVLECKSYLDSRGVSANDFIAGGKNESRYKLFNDDVLRETVFDALREHFIALGYCRKGVQLQLGLVYGKAAFNEPKLIQLFEERGWLLFGPKQLRTTIKKIAAGGYENSTAAVVAKLLLSKLPTQLTATDRL